MKDTKKTTLLAVDDRPDNLFVIRELVCEYIPECEMVTATNGVAGLKTAFQKRPDVMLVDVQMPVMDGIEMCGHLKADDRTKDIPVILVTGHRANAELKAKGLEAGASDFILKPFDNCELVARIKVALRVKVAEDELRRQKETLELAISAANMGMWDYSVRNGEVRYGKKWAELIGFNPDEIEPNIDAWKRLLHPDDVSRSMKKLEENLEGKTGFFETECRLKSKSGEWRWMLGRGKVVERGENGVALRHAGFYMDITDRKNAEKEVENKQAQLIQAGRLASLGEMSTGVAHELNQPLSIIRLCAESILLSQKKNGVRNEEREETIRSIIRSVDRAANIIEHLRKFARSDTGDICEINPVHPVNDSLKFFTEQFRQHQIELETDYRENLPGLMTDGQLLEQVMVNLLSNARHAVDKKEETAEKGYRKKILLRIFQENNSIVFEITDNGVGMSSLEREKCLDPFFTTKEVGDGTGIGLSIVHGIIRELNGNLEIESEKGFGTTMRFVLPFSQDRNRKIPTR